MGGGRGRRATGRVALIAWVAVLAACDASSPAADPPRSVVLVVLDAARADHFGVYGHERATTPRADAFAAGATRYEVAISDASFTFLSVASLFSAMSPAESGLSGRAGGRVPDSIPLLAEIARDAGFATAAYSENPYVTPYFGLAQGFARFEEAFPVAAHLEGRELPSDHASAASAIAVLESVARDRERPFFVYLHFLRPHNPYAPTGAFAGRFGSQPERRTEGSTGSLLRRDEQGPPFDPQWLDQVVALYDENLAQADALFGAVLDALRANGVDDRTIVILAGDHGEAFAEHGRLLHSTQVFDPMIRIPLLVRIPGRAARVEGRPVQLSDLGRALVRHFRGDPGSDADDGLADLAALRRRRDPEGDEPLFAWTNAKTHRVAARTAKRKLVVDARTREIVAHHDLERDPGESQPIPLDAEGERLHARVLEQVDRWTRSEPEAVGDGEIDATRRRQLEALGYAVD